MAYNQTHGYDITSNLCSDTPWRLRWGWPNEITLDSSDNVMHRNSKKGANLAIVVVNWSKCNLTNKTATVVAISHCRQSTRPLCIRTWWLKRSKVDKGISSVNFSMLQKTAKIFLQSSKKNSRKGDVHTTK